MRTSHSFTGPNDQKEFSLVRFTIKAYILVTAAFMLFSALHIPIL